MLLKTLTSELVDSSWAGSRLRNHWKVLFWCSNLSSSYLNLCLSLTLNIGKCNCLQGQRCCCTSFPGLSFLSLRSKVSGRPWIGCSTTWLCCKRNSSSNNWHGTSEEPIHFQYSLIDVTLYRFETQIWNSDTRGSSHVNWFVHLNSSWFKSDIWVYASLVPGTIHQN